MNHRKGDRYLPVKVFTYPLPAHAGGGVEYGYIYRAELYDRQLDALLAGRDQFGAEDDFSVAHIRGDILVDFQGEGYEADFELHTQHLAWVWT